MGPAPKLPLGGPVIETAQSVSLISPNYVQKFQCIGPACEDTCCQAWDIGVDKATYDRYQLIPAEHLLRPLVDSHVVLRPEPRTAPNHAHILLNDSLQCPFLSAEKWCGLQKDLGPEYLSHVCATYPRVSHQVQEHMEQSLHLSCPEAARLVLLDENLLGDAPTSHESYAHLGECFELHTASAVAHPHFAEIRLFLVALLRDRQYPLWQRLFLIGMFSNRLHLFIANGETAQIPRLLRDFAQIAASGSLRPVMEGIPAQPALQLSVVLKLIDMRMGRVLNSMRFLDCTKHFLDGIGYRPGLAVESFSPAYIHAHDNFYQPLMRAHPQMLENYLLNAIFKSVFPFGTEAEPPARSPSYSIEFLTLATHFALVKGLLIGMAGFHREAFSVDHVLLLIQAYGRMIEHHQQFAMQVVRFLEERITGNSVGIAMLLRN